MYMNYTSEYLKYKNKYSQSKNQQFGGNNPEMLIQIKGIPGSGKSYICSQLPETIKCFDTDDFITKAYDKLFDKNVTEQEIRELAIDELNKSIGKHKYVCVVGILFNVEKPTKKYFIELSDDQLESAYRRTILREIEKYKEITRQTITDNIKSLDVNKISDLLKYKYHINAINPSQTSFSEYKKIYNDASNFEKHNGFIIMSQTDIINDIKSMIDN